MGRRVVAVGERAARGHGNQPRRRATGRGWQLIREGGVRMRFSSFRKLDRRKNRPVDDVGDGDDCDSGTWKLFDIACCSCAAAAAAGQQLQPGSSGLQLLCGNLF